jgi:hypothetical protein
LQVGNSYGSIISALEANGVSSSILPQTDPISGTHDWLVPNAEARAIGLLPANNNTPNNFDGTFTFGTGFTYTYDPNNRAVSGEVDFIGVAEHEISEVLGRIGGLGTTSIIGGTPVYMPYDLYRYTAANAPTYSYTVAGAYFSLDKGSTDLKNFNNNTTASPTGGDSTDWDNGTNGQNLNGYIADAFNAFSASGGENDITPVDISALNSLGFITVPEPSSIVLGATGLAALLVWRRRRRNSAQ